MSEQRERLVERIAQWVVNLGASNYELRCGSEIIDAFEFEAPDWRAVDDSAKPESYPDALASARPLAQDVLESAELDCNDEGKPRKYKLVGILEHREQHVCPIPIRFRPVGRTSEDIIAALTKQNADLHATLMRDRKDGFDQLAKFTEIVTTNHHKIVAENAELRAKSGEVIEKLEQLRTKALERDMARERHEKDLELKDRITDAVLPLGAAIAKRLTGTQLLGDVDVTARALIEVCNGMQRDQLERISEVMGPIVWAEFDAFWDGCTAKPPKCDVARFWRVVDALSHEQLMIVASILNVGQQAALKEVLAARHADASNHRTEQAHDRTGN